LCIEKHTDGVIKQDAVLWHNRNRRAKGALSDRGNLLYTGKEQISEYGRGEEQYMHKECVVFYLAIDQYSTTLHVVKSVQQSGQRGLASATLTNNCQTLTRFN
jgi:hypothetical protein